MTSHYSSSTSVTSFKPLILNCIFSSCHILAVNIDAFQLSSEQLWDFTSLLTKTILVNGDLDEDVLVLNSDEDLEF